MWLWPNHDMPGHPDLFGTSLYLRIEQGEVLSSASNLAIQVDGPARVD